MCILVIESCDIRHRSTYATHLDEIRIYYLVAEKAKIDAALQEDRRFYPWMLGYLVGHVLPEELKANTNEVIVIIDTIPVNRKRQAVEKSIWRAVRKATA